MECITRSAVIVLHDKPERAFPMFSPQGEKRWDTSWNPVFLYPENGAWQEGMVFQTPSQNEVEDHYNWILSQLDQEKLSAKYTVFTIYRVWTIHVKCKKIRRHKTEATITYTFNGLNDIGDRLNKKDVEKLFMVDLKDWQQAINTCLSEPEKSDPL